MHSEAWPSIAKSDPPSPYAWITASSSQPIGTLAKAVRDAFQDAMAMRGRLRDEAFNVHGMSGRKFRVLMNNLMSELPDPRYIEIGLFHGASFCSALFKNKIRAVGIDNWSQYNGKRQLFTDNLNNFTSEDTDVEILEEDFRKIDYSKIGKFNILFYDGSHAEIDQCAGVVIPQPAMDDSHILIVDDWNTNVVRSGTFNGLRDAKLRIDYSIEVRTSYHGEFPIVFGPNSEWHNGTLVAVVTKLA
jgi:hypothetical protein